MYLLDTDVLSFAGSTSRLSGPAADAWRDWVRRNEDALFLSTITIMEVRFGIERLEARGASRRSAELSKWLLITETIYRDRIIWVSPEISHKAGELLSYAEMQGVMPWSEDAIIAATAELSGLRLVTRNERHMRAFGIEWLNPLDALPG